MAAPWLNSGQCSLNSNGYAGAADRSGKDLIARCSSMHPSGFGYCNDLRPTTVAILPVWRVARRRRLLCSLLQCTCPLAAAICRPSGSGAPTRSRCLCSLRCQAGASSCSPSPAGLSPAALARDRVSCLSRLPPSPGQHSAGLGAAGVFGVLGRTAPRCPPPTPLAI
jgi:hypothetical protein